MNTRKLQFSIGSMMGLVEAQQSLLIQKIVAEDYPNATESEKSLHYEIVELRAKLKSAEYLCEREKRDNKRLKVSIKKTFKFQLSRFLHEMSHRIPFVSKEIRERLLNARMAVYTANPNYPKDIL